ncbi:hypothetical protein DH86_00002854, partial [Scytalidium sp. 3C]
MGAQWGDEGKGKLVDVLTSEAQLVARAQGGNNAGHTIELEDLEQKGLVNVRERIFISVELGKDSIGTTKRGIGPTYSTKAARKKEIVKFDTWRAELAPFVVDQ